MIKKIKHLEDHQFFLENKLERNQGSSSAASSWLNKYPMPKFSGLKRERPMRFLRDFERYISAIDISTNDFNYVVFACFDGLAREWWDLVSLEHENINSFREKSIKKYWNENVCFQISFDSQFGRHIPNGNLSRVEYAIKIINNAKDLIPPPSGNEIVSRLSRHFHDDIRTAIIMRNVKTYENLIELLEAFDQAGPSNSSSGNNGYNGHSSYNSYQDQRFRSNVYGESPKSNENNFRGHNFVPNMNRGKYGATFNRAQQNMNYNYHHEPGFNGQHYRNNSFPFTNNVARHEGHNYAPTSHVGANLAHDYDRRDYNARNYDLRPYDRRMR